MYMLNAFSKLEQVSFINKYIYNIYTLYILYILCSSAPKWHRKITVIELNFSTFIPPFFFLPHKPILSGSEIITTQCQRSQ